jgi:hypothetical protein
MSAPPGNAQPELLAARFHYQDVNNV